MTLPASGTIRMDQVNTELGKAATAAITMNDANVRSLAGVPSGQYGMNSLWGKSAGPPPGQVVFTGAATTWTVPAGVTSISMVCVNASGSYSAAWDAEVRIGSSTGTLICRASQTSGNFGDVGYTGGALGYSLDYGQGGAGGGGAAGYAGNGGNGGESFGNGAAAAAGSGGGGGGASKSGNGNNGGGVGLNGIGATGGASAGAGVPGSGGSGQFYGGGSGGPEGPSQNSLAGGSLCYKNNYAVSPGQVIWVRPNSVNGYPGGIRIMWGGGRSYPSNAGDM